MARPVAERFWEKVDKDGPVVRSELGPCWMWQATRHRRGYGHFKKDGRTRMSHQVAWEETTGGIPAGLHVLHRCDNPPCVNPAHLFLGTPLDNARDRASKGRGANLTGELGPRAKLRAEDAVVMRYAKSLAGVTSRSLCKAYGVGITTVYDTLHGKRWNPS